MKQCVLAGFLMMCSLQALAQATPGEQFAGVGKHTLAWECRGKGDKMVIDEIGLLLGRIATATK
jgi:hypothetical protein